MYYLVNGLGAKKGCKTLGKILALLFSCFCILASFGIGNIAQVNSISGNLFSAFSIPTYITGILLVFLTGIVVIDCLDQPVERAKSDDETTNVLPSR